jgi:sec-independent protein translocase protein TatA
LEKKIPELARGLGKGIREFKDATKEVSDEVSKSKSEIDKRIDI